VDSDGCFNAQLAAHCFGSQLSGVLKLKTATGGSLSISIPPDGNPRRHKVQQLQQLTGRLGTQNQWFEVDYPPGEYAPSWL